MNYLKDRRIVAAIGAVCALLLAVLIGFVVTRPHGAEVPASTQAASGLQIEQGAVDTSANPTKPLRCFVDGQFVGMEVVADCAKKNGVAAQALDVGLDPATGQAPSGTLAPPVQAPPAPAPQPAAAVAPKSEEADASTAPSGAPGECLRYAPEGWRTVASGTALGQCARALFDGRCEHAGQAIYGRWGGETLRLVPGRVEISGDNRTFRPMVPQNPQDCSLPPG